MRSVLLSARALLSDTTAQMAAGIQPNNVSCSKRQITPVSTFPLKINESQGNRMANNVMAKR